MKVTLYFKELKHPKGEYRSLWAVQLNLSAEGGCGETQLYKFDGSGANGYQIVICVCIFFSLLEGCEVGHWSEWGTCSRNNRTCGFKWGLETRTRQIVKKPAKDTIPCPTIAESRRCKMAMRHCPGGEFREFLSCVGLVLSDFSSFPTPRPPQP